jgi:TRAP-type C4-dicarboxylate transport system substrate-binding protein
VDPLIVYWGQKEWAKFPPEIQKAIQEAAQESARFEKALCRAGLDGQKSLNVLKELNHSMKVPDPIQFMESKGMTVTNLTPEAQKAFIEAVKPIYDKWVPIIGKELYETAKNDMAK